MKQVESSLNLDLDLSLLRLLRPCLGQGASLGEEAVLADSGRAGEVAAGIGRVRRLAYLSILRKYSSVMSHVLACVYPHADRRTIDVLAYRHSFSATC